MIIGTVKRVKIPEDVGRGNVCKYPVDSLSEGQGFLVQLGVGDKDTIQALRKRVVNAVRQQERRLGKTKTGAKVREYVVWIDEEAGGVMVALRKDNSKDAPAQKKKSIPVKKNVPSKENKVAPKGKVTFIPPTRTVV